MALTIGIDLGTTNSCVAIWRGEGPEVIPAPDGQRTTPSVVSKSEEGEWLVGSPAKRAQLVRPERTISSVKRLMGRRAQEATDWNGQAEVTAADSGAARIRVDDEPLAPEQVSAMILAQLARQVAEVTGEEVTRAVITVPAYFNDAERQATRDAGQIAGLEVVRIINEPTAAALAYGLGMPGMDSRVVVFDLGGGTFDVSVLEIADEVYDVLAVAGDNALGGDDVDRLLAEDLAGRVAEKAGIDVSGDPQVQARLLEAAERAKRELSGLTQTQISLPYLTSGPDGPIHVEETLTRAALERIAHPVLSRLEEPLRRAVEEAGLAMDAIDHVVMVGGMTRMPAVREMVQRVTGRTPHIGMNPDEVVALGAAVQAHVLEGGSRDVLLLDVTPLSLGIETKGGLASVLIARNTTIPVTRDEVFTTGEDYQSSVAVHIVQGERELAQDNRSLGRITLLDIAPALRGIPQIAVRFAIDADGILEVSARDVETGDEQTLRMDDATGLADTDLRRMISEAEDNREADRARARLIEARNRADALIWRAEQAAVELADDLAPEERTALLDGIATLRQALAAESDARRLESGVSALEDLFAQLGSPGSPRSIFARTDAADQGGAPRPDPGQIFG